MLDIADRMCAIFVVVVLYQTRLSRITKQLTLKENITNVTCVTRSTRQHNSWRPTRDDTRGTGLDTCVISVAILSWWVTSLPSCLLPSVPSLNVYQDSIIYLFLCLSAWFVLFQPSWQVSFQPFVGIIQPFFWRVAYIQPFCASECEHKMTTGPGRSQYLSIKLNKI